MTTSKGEVIWSKTRPNGKHVEILHDGEYLGHLNLVVNVDGKRVAAGRLLPIARELPQHKNAPAGVSHLVGVFCLMPEDAAEVVAAVEPIAAGARAAYDFRMALGREEYRANVEAAGLNWDEVVAVVSRWGSAEAAWEAGAEQDAGLLMRLSMVK